ncbi:MAG: outer membrane lipoprotein carrier protein LolA [Burkholderiales bacterium]|nr:MAG: outer membrane lipoprotein carrier protein LolA [Burkholderiales bacterium]
MKNIRTLLATTLLIAACAVSMPARALNGLESLENFVKTVKSGKSDFTQTVTSPARAGEAPRVKNSSGTFEFQRPGKFKFAYKKPFEQLILADGTSLWIFDADLNQASQRKQSAAFANTPAALIASATDLSALRNEFTLENAPEKDGLVWISAKPKAADSTLQNVRIGFKGDALQQLDITDSFGQRSLINFTAMQLNPSLPASSFQFTLPKGAELLKQ